MSEIIVKIYEDELLNFPNDMDLGKFIRKRYYELKRKETEKNFTEYDHCMICGKQSPYTKQTHILNRVGYVEGGGQGCFQPYECDSV